MSISKLKAALACRRVVFGVCLLLAGSLALPLAANAAPDLSGPWQAKSPSGPLTTIDGKPPPLLRSARSKQQKLAGLLRKNRNADPTEDCLPPGIPRLMTQPFPFSLVQGRRTIAMTFEWNHLVRLIYMDRDHFEPIGPLYLGQSIGRWDGDTLVIDTNSYNDTTWLDDNGLPHSEEMRTVERIRLINGGAELEDQVTFTDAKAYSKPWTARIVFTKRLGIPIKEDYCLGRVGKGRTKTD